MEQLPEEPAVTYTTIKVPEASEWVMTWCDYVHVRPVKGKEPCWFHRKMQEIAFGVRWTKL